MQQQPQHQHQQYQPAGEEVRPIEVEEVVLHQTTSSPRNDDDDADNSHQHHDHEEENQQQQRRWWNGNWGNPIWVLGTVYLLVFVCYMGLAQFGNNKTAGFILHALLALAFVLSCAWNLFHTPSHGPSFARIHRWMGWSAVISGFFVVLTGYVIVLLGNSTLSQTANIVFMSTGAFQVVVQILLVVCIKYLDKAKSTGAGAGGRGSSAVWYHMVCGSVLFYACALMPAINRAPQIFGFPDSDTFTFAILPLGFILIFISVCYYSRQMKLEQQQKQQSEGGGLDTTKSSAKEQNEVSETQWL